MVTQSLVGMAAARCATRSFAPQEGGNCQSDAIQPPAMAESAIVEQEQVGHTVSLTGRRWIWPELQLPVVCDTAPQPRWVSELLEARGISGERAVQEYLEPSLGTLPDPSLMRGMDQAVERLCRAIRARESITIWGDYDVDGVCATAVLVDFLRRVAEPATIHYYIPDRRQEGYGLNPEGIASIAERGGVLVTVDSGVTAVDEIELANQLGLDVLVVDHHQVGHELPRAHAILNPHQPGCEFPFKGLCAAGVAFMLAVALRRALRAAGYFETRQQPDVRELLDITALATVADMVPILGLNRVLVAAGLRSIAAQRRSGLNALMTVAKVAPTKVTASDLGYQLGPRINARGRIGHAGAAVELLLTQDPEAAKTLAHSLELANRHRRTLEQETVEMALKKAQELRLDAAPGIVLYDPTWHPGVLGLVATRLVNQLHRPAVVIGEGGKGSGRSVDGLDLLAAIRAQQALLLRFGGHKAAAGLTIAPQQVEAFREGFCTAVQMAIGRPPYIPTLRPDLEVHSQTLTWDTARHLARLGPFGQQNPEPLLVTRGMSVRSCKVVGEQHLKLVLAPGMQAIAFRMAHLAPHLPSAIDVAYRLERNEFRGVENLQLRVEDIRPSC